MHIVFTPSDSRTNLYSTAMVGILRDNGYSVIDLPYFLTHPGLWKKVKYVHLNWFENISGRSAIQRRIQYQKQRFKLFFLSILGKKIVWTMHNKTQHEGNRGCTALEDRLVRTVLNKAYKVVIHCHQSRSLLKERYGFGDARIFYCPHPNYINRYGTAEGKEAFATNIKDGKDKKTIEILFLGAIRPYKNIELLIQAFSNFLDGVAPRAFNWRLTIAGEPLDEDYGKKIASLAGASPQISLQLGFVPDERIARLIGSCDLMVLPYDMHSSLNSGSAYLAFSYRKTVIAPLIGSIEDLGDIRESVLYYTYTRTECHLDMVEQMFRRAYFLYQGDEGCFKRRGEAVYNFVQQYHSDTSIAAALNRVYNDSLVFNGITSSGNIFKTI